MLKRVEPGMVFLLENTSRRSHDKVPVFKFAQSLTTNMTIFSSQLFLALAEPRSVSVKVVLYKKCNSCPVLCSTTD